MSSEGGKPARNNVLLFRKLPQALRFSVAEKRGLKRFADDLAGEIAGYRPFTCVIADDCELRRLNRLFLKHDYATDVLSFPSGQPDGDLGEMAISIERAAAQAGEFGHARLDEICILMLHGVLHLTGLDHRRDRGAMARAERKWQLVFGLPPALLARNETRQKVASQ